MTKNVRMPKEELEQTPEYCRLTSKQQLFVATYCEAGLAAGVYDPIAATLIAYKCKSEEVARIMSYALMANIRIVAALNRHFQTAPIEEFLMLLDRAINNKKLTIAQLQALKLKCDVLGFANRLPGVDRQATSRIPPDIAEASKQARKAKRKPTVKTPKPAEPSEYAQEAARF